MQNWEEVQLAVAALRQRLGAALPSRPDAAIILGTGLSGLVERMEDTVSVPYADLPGFPVSTVASHAGAFVLGRLGGRTVLVQQGLIVRVRQGVGRASRIYVKIIAGAENDPHDSQKTAGHAGEILPTNKNIGRKTKKKEAAERQNVRSYDCSEEESL